MKKPIFKYRKLPKQYRVVAKDAVTFVLNRYCPKMVDRIVVTVIYMNLTKYKVWAAADYKRNDTTCREFTIEMHNNMSPYQFIRTLMHELIHVKQYAKNEMKHYERDHNIINWKSKKIDLTKKNYWECPWEIEAHGLEEGLTQIFMKEYPQHKPFCRTKKMPARIQMRVFRRRPRFINRRKLCIG